ncbi:ATP-dependent Lon protease pim1 [Orbilia oligospora]|uniref:Lon protease homolog, mitochondrial n=1 Tax=Orbilia oligospora TaxID=2813651 RepID=A0A7C8KG57_ORBOL|nr:ATP-dependent Lon protease pim1 [Orbilia oligospora]KAF3175448.1 ATP-dependent Lon protease pim1 [Orbilia oligospora]KAF3252011.1 ATP-dependent Lon protease pim1 [Orbilia oligospora]KAF3252012.1 ATP-dependent Lon protease pim1, variant 2 [Orbilia oligospora]KAF3264780.1 ATP-dependent Lon protease pim1 [Orbilia oligospora]
MLYGRAAGRALRQPSASSASSPSLPSSLSTRLSSSSRSRLYSTTRRPLISNLSRRNCSVQTLSSETTSIQPWSLYSPPFRLHSRTFTSTSIRLKEKVPKQAEEVVKEEEPIKEEPEERQAAKKSNSGSKDNSSSNPKGAAGSSGASPPDGAEPPSATPPSGNTPPTKKPNLLSKPQVPEIYPQVMAIPIAKRPLFPGFYKAVTIRDPAVTSAIQEMLKRGQPYVGVFLFRDENMDADTISSVDEVHDVGVFAQITSVFPVTGEEHSLTAVLYPHRRIKLQRLVPPKDKAQPASATITEIESKTTPTSGLEEDPATSQATTPPKDAESTEPQGDVVASFEETIAEIEQQKPSPSTSPTFATAFLQKYNVSLVDVENLTELPHDKKSPVIKAVTSEIVSVFKDIANMNPLFRDQISTFQMSHSAGNVIEEPAKLADFAAAVASAEVKELQEVLETLDVEDRLHKSLVVLKKELMNAELQSKIAKDVEQKIQKRQREYWLMEQMKGIRRELGIESDGKDKLIEKFKEKASKLAMPEAVKKVFDEELNKLTHLEAVASEFNVTRNYLDWLTQIPWGQRSAENYSIKNAMKVLDEDHHGLKDVKDRILEFIAVGKLRGGVEGKILCFVGPPGVGKTSIGKSIARAVQREFYRFSVGGLTDVAEIKGHRRTYVGALPGRIIQALKKCQTENPLILIDEVDKIGRGHQGDPASALLELLDPEQNNAFLDHYMDVPVDLSKVLFVCTANMSDTIPRPLLDRMEMIELSGYVADEKMAIAERYLAPQAKTLSGLDKVDVDLTKEAIEELIKSYCRESGVRNLKKHIEKVYRKAALKIVQDIGEEELPEEKALTEEGKKAQEETAEKAEEIADPQSDAKPATTEIPRAALEVPETVHVAINKENLKDYVGPPVYTSDRLYETTPPGVTMGLAWTQLGGSALYVESILESALDSDSRPGLERTGNLQNVMKESTAIAYSFAKSFMVKKFPENKFLEKARVHLHCPEGAVPKDGPSAGITMATSLLSLALDTPVSPTVAMTGELTVTGKVLRIGGLREKTVAAKRSGASTVVFPADNMSDWLELPENIKEGIEGRPVSWYSEVFDIIFSGIDTTRASNLWKEQLKKKPRGASGEEPDSLEVDMDETEVNESRIIGRSRFV